MVIVRATQNLSVSLQATSVSAAQAAVMSLQAFRAPTVASGASTRRALSEGVGPVTCQHPCWRAPVQSLPSSRSVSQPVVETRRQTRAVQAHATTPSVAPEQEKEDGYDVYVYEGQPLQEGEHKHVISAFVADESGLINRVAGVFARRGANIESLAVGLNHDKALFTIVVAGTAVTVANLCKQLAKLVKVRYVEDITAIKRIERELMLIKLRAPAGPTRTEVLQLAEIFRARVVDVSDNAITLCLSGDPGKTFAMQKVLSKFGVLEVARTGRISLKRGVALLDNMRPTDNRAPRGSSNGSNRPEPMTPITLQSRDADVYQVDAADASGVWDVTNILDAPGADEMLEGTSEGDTEYQAHTLSLVVSDKPGVLQNVTMLFARRGYNVQSLAVGPAELPGESRITMVVPGKEGGIATLLKHVRKLVDVIDVTDLTEKPYVARELMLVKVNCSASQRGELRDLVQIFRCSVIDVSAHTMTLEVQGREDKMRAIVELMEPYGVLEIARTGRIALPRESGVDTKYLDTLRSSRAW